MASRFPPAMAPGLIWPLLSCTVVGPDFEAPVPDLPAAYTSPIPALFQEQEPRERWWELFESPVLDDLIRRGLAGNLDLQVAQSRVREAHARAQGVAALSEPSLDLGTDATGQGTVFHSDGSPRASGEVSGTVTAFWDLDLFGGLLRGRQAAYAEAARQDMLAREAARLTVSEIARTFIELRATQRRLELVGQSLDLQNRTLTLVKGWVASGLAPSLDQVRAEAAVATLEADVGPLRTEIGRDTNAMAVLVGEPPGTLAGVLGEGTAVPVARTGGAMGVPLDLVRRRPDIQAAELQIAVATAEVGVATAELYPRLTLPGTLSVGLSGLGMESIVVSILSSLSVAIDLPLFDAGLREADITAAEERVVQAALLYRETLLRAMEEVEAALLGYEGARSRREALVEAVEDNRVAFEQSKELYRQGFVTFLDVLDSQREWNRSLQDLTNAERDVSLEVVNLFSALGGAGRDA